MIVLLGQVHFRQEVKTENDASNCIILGHYLSIDAKHII